MPGPWISDTVSQSGAFGGGIGAVPSGEAGMAGQDLAAPPTMAPPTGHGAQPPGGYGSPEPGEPTVRTQLPRPAPNAHIYDMPPDPSWGAEPNFQGLSDTPMAAIAVAEQTTGDPGTHGQLSPDIAGHPSRPAIAPAVTNSYSGMPDISDDRLEGLRADIGHPDYPTGAASGPVTGNPGADTGSVATGTPAPWSAPTLNVFGGDSYYG